MKRKWYCPPFIDPDTEEGFAINYIDQMVSCTFGSCVIPTAELLTCVLKNNASAAAAVIEISLKDFKLRMKTEQNVTDEFVPEFRNIILKILDLDRRVFGFPLISRWIWIQWNFYSYFRFVVDFTDILYWKHFLQPIILVYAITISIFAFVKVNIFLFGLNCIKN